MSSVINSLNESIKKKYTPQKEEPKTITKEIIREVPVKDERTQAVARVAYEKANAAMEVANGYSAILAELTKAVKTLQPNKSFCLKINRDKNGFISTIDVDCK